MTSDATHVVAALREAFAQECRELGLSARLDVHADRFTPAFDPQFGAQPAWLRDTLFEELRERGVCTGAEWDVQSSTEVELSTLLEHLRAALRRTRARLVDTDSWVSGGFEWPFAVDDAVVRARGLAVYRAPARANAAIAIAPGRVTITIPAGDCGAIVSAGIWVPTALAGDFDIVARYELSEWNAGERESCLGLFAVSPDGTFRSYAQRVAQRGVETRVMADLDGRVGSTNALCTQSSGVLRIERDRDVLSAWHREHATWTWLGRIRTPPAGTLHVGLKIWALGRVGTLAASLVDFSLSATAAEAQGPPLAVRPDPLQLV